jgi:hypothetical protein
MQLKDQDPRRFGVRTYRDADGNLKSVDVDANADEIRKHSPFVSTQFIRSMIISRAD